MILSSVLLNAQNENTNNSDLKHEIGIDMQGLFKGYPGSSLIYKVRDRKQSPTANYVKNCRYQLAMSGRLSLGNKTITKESFNDFVDEIKSENSFYIHPQIGMERLRMFDRFGLYYGADTGPFYQSNSPGYSVKYSKNPNTNIQYLGTPSNYYTLGWSFTPFFGMKYKLNQHFSFAMETGLNVNYSFRESSNYLLQANQGVLTQKIQNKNKNQSLETYMDFLRFMTLNYHF